MSFSAEDTKVANELCRLLKKSTKFRTKFSLRDALLAHPSGKYLPKFINLKALDLNS